ncbi:hypothetical protein COOONC_01119, partial [Cooperia oncophora]
MDSNDSKIEMEIVQQQGQVEDLVRRVTPFSLHVEDGLQGSSVGTRFRPLSLQLPKPLFPIAGVPLVEHHIDQLSQ